MQIKTAHMESLDTNRANHNQGGEVSSPQRIRLSRRKGFELQAYSRSVNGLDAVNVSRPGPWGNPFIVNVHGSRSRCAELYGYLITGHICLSTKNAKEQVMKHEYIVHHIDELKGKNLACWCRMDGLPCHADYLLELAK